MEALVNPGILGRNPLSSAAVRVLTVGDPREAVRVEYSFCEGSAVLASDAVHLCCQEIRFVWIQMPEEVCCSIAGSCQD